MTVALNGYPETLSPTTTTTTHPEDSLRILGTVLSEVNWGQEAKEIAVIAEISLLMIAKLVHMKCEDLYWGTQTIPKGPIKITPNIPE